MQVSKKDWMESVQLVFDYFCERTPRCASALSASDRRLCLQQWRACMLLPTAPFEGLAPVHLMQTNSSC